MSNTTASFFYHLVRPVESPLVREWRLPPELHDGLEIGQLVLDEEHLLQEGLALHDHHVGLGVQADAGDVVGARLGR